MIAAFVRARTRAHPSRGRRRQCGMVWLRGRDMPHEVRVLTEADLRAAVPLDLAAADDVERAFAALATGEVVMPSILSM